MRGISTRHGISFAHFQFTVVVEFVAAVAVLVAAAALTELAPADGPLQVDVAAKSATFDQHSPAGNLDVWLLGRITGEPSDRFTLTVSTPEGNAPEDILRVIVESTASTSSGIVSDRFDAQALAGNPGIHPRFAPRSLGRLESRRHRPAGRCPRRECAVAVDTKGTGLQPPRFVSDKWCLPRMTLTSWFTLALALAAVAGGVVGVKKLPRLEPLAAASC